jgi:hypothetical protein
MRVAILRKATANLNATWVCEEINKEIGPVSYSTVLKIIKAAGIDLTEAASKRMKRLHADPEFAARHAAAASARLKRLHADPEYAAANRERMKRRRSDPEFAAQQAAAASERMKRQHADPAFEARRIAGIRKAKAKRRNSA